MAKLTDKTALGATPANNDVLHLVDISDPTSDPAGTSFKITVENLLKAITNVLLPANFNFNNFRGINLASPIGDLDAANKQYVDNLIDGLKWKECARVATTGNITLANLQTVDGVSLAAGDRVLVKEQTSLPENGIYDVVDGGAWTRSEDANTGEELVCASIDTSPEGATLDNKSYAQTTADPINLGVSDIVFVLRASTTDHNSLGGLQGGTATERNHLTNSQVGIVNDAMTKAIYDSGGAAVNVYDKANETGIEQITGPIITPPQLTATTDDYSPTGYSTCNVIRQDIDIDKRQITGLVAPTGGVRRIIRITNLSTVNDIRFMNNNAGSLAANRFLLRDDNDKDLKPNETASFWYDHTSVRWRPLSRVG